MNLGKTKLLVVPANHKIAMEVPLGGSNCAKCKFVSQDGRECANKFYLYYTNGNPVLPKPANRFCCDMFETRR